MAETFVQPKITGYRQLSEAEANLMNLIKAEGNDLALLVGLVTGYLDTQRKDAGYVEGQRIDNAQPGRWASIARTHFQEGLMALTRSVAQPTSF